ncbi:MAG: poly-gamma-glutamate biosynthesis protein PgsC [Desulfobacteraceae bacterium]|nr:MAG: poly-gamma-glutamate biosynthesis protein PgsC [Desulfobacteraceae bacterium]
MEELITLSIGLGLVTSLAFSEFFGVAAGGMVVPGYIALYLDKPVVIVVTMLASYLTYFLVHALSSVMIIYGRRRTVLMILIGFLLGWLIRFIGHFEMAFGTIDLTVVGYIIPGLIAIWIDRQGIIETFSTLVIASVIVRLGLILFRAGELIL